MNTGATLSAFLLVISSVWLFNQMLFGQQVDVTRPIEVLFLGDDGPHEPDVRARILSDALTSHEINISYRDNLSVLNRDSLSGFDAILIYADHSRIRLVQLEALLNGIASGKGFIGIHGAAGCFQHQTAYHEMLGARLISEQADTTYAHIIQPDHPVVDQVESIESVADALTFEATTLDQLVLMVRKESGRQVPMAWIRGYGNGRVFYTALGHTTHTWNNPAFQLLIKNAIVWSVSEDVRRSWIDGRNGGQ